jgi:hypothetical protein
MVWDTILFSLGFPIVRSVLGWLENALADGKIEKFEVKQLGETILRIATPVILVGMGVTFIGADQAITIATAAVSTLIDFLWNKFHKAVYVEE